jgi:hypothetical protein
MCLTRSLDTLTGLPWWVAPFFELGSAAGLPAGQVGLSVGLSPMTSPGLGPSPMEADRQALPLYRRGCWLACRPTRCRRTDGSRGAQAAAFTVVS